MGQRSSQSLVIDMLGPLQVRVGGLPADFRTDAERALLACLASAQGTPLRRDTLAALLSPERPDVEALTYLRNRLTRLRDALGDAAATPPWLVVDRKQIALRAGDDIVVDAAQLERQLATVERHAHRELAGCPACLERLHAAARLVRGELLAGLNFPSEPWQSWLAAQREHYRRRAIEALTLLRTALLARGAWADALAIAQHQLRLEPWHEPAHRAIMLAHAQLGDRSAALAQFAQCETLLQDELGAEPEAATRQLYRQIFDQGPVAAGGPDVPDNLPPQTGPFFGREDEQAQLLQRLVDPAYRLITIVGAGGMGKTRLAIEVARRLKAAFPDGVWFVALGAAGGGAEQLKIAVGEAMGLVQHFGSPPGAVATDDGRPSPAVGRPELRRDSRQAAPDQPGRQLTGDQVLAILRDRRALLILDNCEPVLGALAFVPEWLRRAPQVAFLATSREPLGFQAEALLALAALPSGEDTLGPAEALFAERGRMARAAFVVSDENLPLVRQICALVDGAPLGIALAAAWVRRRSLAQIRDAIGRSLDFLSTNLRDVDPRHRSMRAVFETSWQLLAPGEQAALAALAVFPATFTAEAAAAVAGATLPDLDTLCEKSLLQQQHEPERYLLHSLLRQFAADKLATRAAELDGAFVDYFDQVAERHQHDYDALQPEWRNLLAAVVKAHGLAAWRRVLDLVQRLDEPWLRQLRLSDLREGLTLALEAAITLRDQRAMARTALRLGEIEIELNAYAVAAAHLAEAARQFTSLEEGLGIAQATYLLGRINNEQAQDELALQRFETSRRMFEEEHDPLGVAKNLNLIAVCHAKKYRDFPAARAYLEQAVALQRQQPLTPTYVETLRNLARVTAWSDDDTLAEQLLAEAAAVSRQLRDLGEYAAVLYERVLLHKRRGQVAEALACGHECLDSFKKLGSLRWEALVKTQLGLLHQARQEHAAALRFLSDGLQIFDELGDPYEQAYSHYYLSRLYAEIGEPGQSLRAREAARRLNLELRDPQLAERLG